MSLFFNGRLWVSPATMSAVDDRAMYNANLSVGNVLAIIGKSPAGKPNTPLRFGSAAQARAVLGSCESLNAIEKAFDPSSETYGPSEVVFVRVNPATQSILSLLDSAAAPCIDLKSSDYGLLTTGIRVKVEAGSISGNKVSTSFNGNNYTADNVFRNALSVVYTGLSVTATLSITETTLTLNAGTSIIIDLATYPTIASLVDRINGVSGFFATVIDGNDNKPSLRGLDGVTSQSVKTTAYVATANLQSIIDWINSASEGFVTATRTTGALKSPTNVDWTFLTSGIDGVTANTDWSNGFTTLQTVDVQWVVPVTPLDSIHAMTRDHCTLMSNIMRMERRCIVGCDISMSDTGAISAAKALNSDRISYTHLGFYDYDATGALVLYPPYILAGLLGGMFAGVNPGTALTNKAIKIRGVERLLRNPTDTDQLLLGGVLCIENTNQGYKVVQSITTWLINTNYNRREVSVGVAVDFVARNVRNALDVLRGQKATPLILTEAVSRVETALRALAQPEPMGPAVIVGDAKNPAYKNITASIEGDVLRVEFQCSPVISINYIPIVLHAVPWTGVATA